MKYRFKDMLKKIPQVRFDNWLLLYGKLRIES